MKKSLTLEERRFRWEKKEAKIKREDELKKSAIDGASSAAPTLVKALLLFGGQYLLFRQNWDARSSAVTSALFTGVALSDIDSEVIWGAITAAWAAHALFAFAKEGYGGAGRPFLEEQAEKIFKFEAAARELEEKRRRLGLAWYPVPEPIVP